MPKKQKRKATSWIVTCITAAFFLGLGLGAILNAVLMVMALSIVAGAIVGFTIDRRNGISYTKPR